MSLRALYLSAIGAVAAPEQDDLSCGNISVKDQSTIATMFSLRKGLGFDSATGWTDLARVLRIHSHDLAPSFDSFVREERDEHPQTSIRCSFRQMSIANHKGQGQCLNGDEAELIDQFPRDRMPPFSTLISDSFVQFGNPPLGIFPSPGTFLAARHLPLPDTQPPLTAAEPPRSSVKGTVRKSYCVDQAKVNPDLWARMIYGFGLWDVKHEADEPLFPPPLDHNPSSHRIVGEVSVPADRYIANILDVKPLKLGSTIVPNPSTILNLEPQRAEVSCSLEAGVASEPLEEARKSVIEPSGDLLAGRCVEKLERRFCFLPPGRDQLVAVIFANADPALLPALPTVSQKMIVKSAAYPEKF